VSATKGKFNFLRPKSDAPEQADSPRTRNSESVSTRISDRRPGRPNGKRSDENYTQVTAYLLKNTHQAVKIRLLQEGKGREFSELVQELLDDWLK
jgi:hypothetical protein